MAHDEKRLYREIKRDMKRQGNRKRRRFLKNVEADPGDFEFGADRSADLNGMDRANRPRDEDEEVGRGS